MTVLGLDSVMFFVTDMDRSLAWYQDALGMAVLRRHGDFAVLQAGDVRVSLHGGASAEGFERGGVTPVFLVPDYDAARAELEGKGCTFTFENRIGGASFGSFSDPDGNPIQILSRAAG